MLRPSQPSLGFSRLYFLFFVLLCFSELSAQAPMQEQLSEINQKRLKINKIGMLTLGSWALGNMAYSGVALRQAPGADGYFYQMNIYWNVVNLALAGSGYYQALHTDPATLGLAESVSAHHQIKSLLLLNAGLDVGYMAAGLYMRERSKNAGERADMWEGFGRSLLLQGAFLFVFDLTLYGIHQAEAPKLHKVLESIQLSPQGVGLLWQF